LNQGCNSKIAKVTSVVSRVCARSGIMSNRQSCPILPPSSADERQVSNCDDLPAVLTTQAPAEEALAEPFARLNVETTEMVSASPPTHQAEAAASSPPRQRHDDDGPNSTSSCSRHHQQGEEEFETILKQMFPDRSSGEIQGLLGTNPTREKALEVANWHSLLHPLPLPLPLSPPQLPACNPSTSGS